MSSSLSSNFTAPNFERSFVGQFGAAAVVFAATPWWMRWVIEACLACAAGADTYVAIARTR